MSCVLFYSIIHILSLQDGIFGVRFFLYFLKSSAGKGACWLGKLVKSNLLTNGTMPPPRHFLSKILAAKFAPKLVTHLLVAANPGACYNKNFEM